jgi:hypothetical protein
MLCSIELITRMHNSCIPRHTHELGKHLVNEHRASHGPKLHTVQIMVFAIIRSI